MDAHTSQKIRDEYGHLTPDQRRCLLSILTESFVTSFPYYSKVQIIAETADARPGPFTYTLARGVERRAFSYAYDSGTAEAAGFPAGYIATKADTNLGKAQETISGETVNMIGIAIQMVEAYTPDETLGQNGRTSYLSDARFAALCSDALAVGLQLNASQQQYKFGIYPMLPGAGGLDGVGSDGLASQAIAGGRALFGNFYNGRTYMDNFFYLPEGLQWQPAGKRDSQLTVRFEFERIVTAFSGGDADNTAVNGVDEDPAAGVRGYLYPKFLGFSLMVHLKGNTTSLRTMVT